MSGKIRRMIYNNIKHDIVQCKSCPLSAELDYGNTPQWGMGSHVAKIFVINHRTSLEAHLIEKPIETKCTLLLKKLLDKSGIQESDIFVTNLIKCACKTTPAKQYKQNMATCINKWIPNELLSFPTVKFILTFGQETGKILYGKDFELSDDPIERELGGKKYPTFSTYSLEEIFRKGQVYTDHAVATLRRIKEENDKV